MLLITWNVQWCRGCDGVVDTARIARVARDMADFDVLCLQEVARNFPGLDGSAGEDQFRLLAEALPGYTLIEGVATDRLLSPGAPLAFGSMPLSQFGNAILTRLPVLQVFRHLLPWPADPAVPSMQRIAVEVVLAGSEGPFRVTTTHLEYYSTMQRMAQVEKLRELQAEAASHARDRTLGEKAGGPFAAAPRPCSGLLTGDFNFLPGSPEYQRMQAAQCTDVPAYVDAWSIVHPGHVHSPTVGLYDKEQWPEALFCFDFIFVTADLAPRVREVAVNAATNASDHQPVLIRLDD